MKTRFLATAVLALACAAAQADTVRLDDYTYGGQNVNVTTSVPSFNHNGGTGGFSGQLNDNTSFSTYCTDLFQTFNFGVTYTNYSVIDFSAGVASDLSRLFTSHFAEVNTSVESAAFQVAIWEILYDQGSGFALGSGNFVSTGNTAVNDLAQSYLGSLGSDFGYIVKQLHSDSNQDFLVFNQGTPTVTTAVPEPETYALMLAGLAAMGFVGKRRKTA